MLKYRLAVLNDYVDNFVLVEANQTHLGHPKPLFFNENLELFEKYKDKLVHIIVDLPYVYPNIDYKNNKPYDQQYFSENGEQWINEAFQRHCISHAFDKLNIEPTDYIIVSDLDEIANPYLLHSIKLTNYNLDFYKLEMDLYHYHLNNKSDEKWYHPYIMSYGYYTNYINYNESESGVRLYLTEFRMRLYKKEMVYIKNGGWHLTYFGDANFIKNKRLNYAHIEGQCETNLDLNNIQNEINKSIHLSINDNDNLPPLHLEYLRNFILC